jgi:FkbM family methyltransferase
MLQRRVFRRKIAAILNGFLISTAGAKLIPAKSKTFSCKKLRSTLGETTMSVAHGANRATLKIRDGSSDWMTFDQIFIDEDYDLRRLARFHELDATYRKIVAAGETPLIVDLGANVGFSAAYFQLIWPQARIVAVEPDPDNVRQLNTNVENLKTVDVVPAAVSSRPGTLQIKDGLSDKNAIQVVELGSGSGPLVPAITLPDIFERYAAQHCSPFIVKIDIEGAEADLFSCNTEWIDSVPLLIVELHDWLYPRERRSLNFLAKISKLDRDFVYLDENVFSIRN